MGGEEVDIVVETPKFGVIKWRAEGGVDYVSPIPCPFNYGCSPTVRGGDGDPQDVVLVGPRRASGAQVRSVHRGTVRFVDDGQVDDKWVCGDAPLSRRQRWVVTGFFVAYGPLKTALNRLRGRTGTTGYRGWVPSVASQDAARVERVD